MEQQGVARVLEPPISLYHEQRLPGLDAEGRQAGPRRANLARIDRPRRFGEGRAQSRIGLVAPDLGVGQVAFALGQRDAVRHARCPGLERDPPGARTHLDLQIAVGRQPQGKFACQGKRYETLGQGGCDQFLPHRTRDGDLEHGFEPRGYIVGDAPERSRRHLVRNRLRHAAFTQPKPLVRAPRQHDVLTVHGERQQPADAGHLERCRPFVPGERAAHVVRTRLQADRGHAVPQYHFRAPSCGRHVLRPHLAAPRQRHPIVVAVDRPGLLEPTAVRGHRQVQLPRPGANEVSPCRGGTVVEERAASVFFPVQDPILPILQILGDVDGAILAVACDACQDGTDGNNCSSVHGSLPKTVDDTS